MCRVHPFRKRCDQLIRVDRLAYVVVHPRSQKLILFADEHIGCQRNDGQLGKSCILAKWVHTAHPATLKQEEIKSVQPDAPPDLPVVRVVESLRRIGGNVNLYYSLLDMFRTNHRHIVEEIRASLSTNDLKTAERQAHTLKGITGSLGAEELQSQAGMLEKNLKNGELGDVPALLEKMKRDLDNLLNDIDNALLARKS